MPSLREDLKETAKKAAKEQVTGLVHDVTQIYIRRLVIIFGCLAIYGLLQTIELDLGLTKDDLHETLSQTPDDTVISGIRRLRGGKLRSGEGIKINKFLKDQGLDPEHMTRLQVAETISAYMKQNP